jgi:hypothetical protein
MDFSSLRHQPVETVIRLKNGMLLLPSDNGSSPAVRETPECLRRFSGGKAIICKPRQAQDKGQ